MLTRETAMATELKALLFDVDGTLANTERDGHRVAFNRAFAENGLDWHWDESLYGELLAVSGGKERIRYFMDDCVTGFEPPTDAEEFVRELHADKQRFYLELMKQGAIPLRPGVERLLREARESGLRLAVVTTTTPESVAALLESNLGPESLRWFDVIAAGDVVPRKKPAPDIYHHALRELDLPAAACLALEDSDNGIESSTGAGVKTVVTVNDYTLEQDFSAALIVLDQLGEPGAGFTVLAGDAGDAEYVDVAFLKRLFSQSSD